MAGTLTISGMSAGLASGYEVIGPVTDTGTSTIGQKDDATLASGDNTFSVPTGATHVAIFLGTSSVTVKVRTSLNLLDGGLNVGGTGWVKFPLNGATSVILNASGTLAGVELQFI